MLVKEPWYIIESKEDKQYLENELKKEINNSHILFEKEISAFIRRNDCDDVVYKLSDNSYALVHLTWSGSIESNKNFPYVKIYKNIDDLYKDTEE